MGLAERRATKQFQDTQFGNYQKAIHGIVGFAVPIEVSWDQLAEEGRGEYYEEWWGKVFFQPVIEGLGRIARDDMGKEALKDSLKKIEFRNTLDTANPDRAISFDNGVLVIDHKLANVDDVNDRTKTLVNVLEKNL